MAQIPVFEEAGIRVQNNAGTESIDLTAAPARSR